MGSMLLATLLVICALQPWTVLAMRADYLAQLRRETVDMFYHGYSNYMQHAFPEDEVRHLKPMASSRLGSCADSE